MAGRARSPRDPVFWVHHAMIDACWFEWNFRRSHGNPDDDDWNSREMRGFVDGDGNPTTMTVADSLLLPVTSYQYDDLQLGVALLGSREPLPTDAVEAKKIAQEGTDVELEVMAQFIEPVNAQARVGEPVRASMDIRGAPLGGLFGDDPDARCLLVVVVDAPHDPPDFAVRAFFRADATRETSLDDPTYIGSFALFSPGTTRGRAGTAGVQSGRLRGVESDGRARYERSAAVARLDPYSWSHRRRPVSVRSSGRAAVRE